MSFYLEYIVPPEQGESGYDFPQSEEHRGYTIPLSETDAETVHVGQLPVRSEVYGAGLDEAMAAAEEILGNSKASRAELYDDPNDSLQRGSGTLVASYTEGAGWREASR